MMDNMRTNKLGINILLLSVGTRNKIVQYFKNALTDKNGERIGIVVATDMSKLAPAIYEADKFYVVSSITDEHYIEFIIEICQKEHIKGILSLIDPELSLLAYNCNRFEKIGTTIIGSGHELCEMSLDKMKMYRWLSHHGYNTARSYTDKESFYRDVETGSISYPVFIKPVKGYASIESTKVCEKEMVEVRFSRSDDLMIQEYMNGEEIGADVYIDMITGKVVSIFTKKKIKMRAGETDKAVSFKDCKLFQLIKQFAEEAGYMGQIDIDIFKIDSRYYISEVNPRFGGGYPHAYEAGVNHMQYIINNLKGKENEENIGGYEEGIYMMKYNEICVKCF